MVFPLPCKRPHRRGDGSPLLSTGGVTAEESDTGLLSEEERDRRPVASTWTAQPRTGDEVEGGRTYRNRAEHPGCYASGDPTRAFPNAHARRLGRCWAQGILAAGTTSRRLPRFRAISES